MQPPVSGNSTSNTVHVVEDVSQTKGKMANECKRTRETGRVGAVYTVERNGGQRGD